MGRLSLKNDVQKTLEQNKTRIKESLAVFPIGVVTFGTAKELGRRFVCASCLNLPNVCCIVATFWTLNAHRGQRAKFLLFFADYSYKLLRIVLYYFRRNFRLHVPLFGFFIAALGARQH